MAPLRDQRREVVRRGYDRIGVDYLASRPTDGRDMALLDELTINLPARSRILDAGCGAGVPVARSLLASGHRVTGVDVSMAQLALAAVHVPDLRVMASDMAALPVASGSMDGLVCYYAVIHVPREDHPQVFAEFRRVLRGGGRALICLGMSDIPEDLDHDSWLGTPMFWSHHDAERTAGLVSAAAFQLTDSWDVADPMGHGGHTFVLARAV